MDFILPDGSQRTFDAPVSVHGIAADMGPGLANFEFFPQGQISIGEISIFPQANPVRGF
jgi:hypothetical protein